VTRIALEEVQGNVLRAYGITYEHARHLLMAIEDPARAARVLRGWLGQLSFDRPRRRRPRRADGRPVAGHPRPATHLNIAFTYAGLERLGVPAEELAAFPDDFRQGPRDRWEHLGDPEAADWEEGFETAHVLVTVHATGADELEDRVRDVLAAAGPALSVLHEDRAELLRHDRDRPPSAEDASCGTTFSREHFGFADGCSQPAIEGLNTDPQGGGLFTARPSEHFIGLVLQDLGIRDLGRTWRPVRAGEFLLGHENEDGRRPAGPTAPLGPNGTFMVYRKLAQDVGLFRRHLEAEARRLGVDARMLEAKVVGRWPDGSPLTRCPAEPDVTVARSTTRSNAFLFDEDGDAAGARCPLGAHIRRTNPRDAMPGGAERTMRHRMIRRGMPYGRPYDEAKGRAPGDRGLLFICFASSIANGFEFVQREWCGTGRAFGLGDEPDYLLQQPEAGTSLRPMTIQGRRVMVLRPPKRPFVTVRGCAYLFVPSRTACAWLSGLHDAA
jgi:Dyp-type peroxidase family